MLRAPSDSCPCSCACCVVALVLVCVCMHMCSQPRRTTRSGKRAQRRAARTPRAARRPRKESSAWVAARSEVQCRAAKSQGMAVLVSGYWWSDGTWYCAERRDGVHRCELVWSTDRCPGGPLKFGWQETGVVVGTGKWSRVCQCSLPVLMCRMMLTAHNVVGFVAERRACISLLAQLASHVRQ